jgi:hypothetical protein
MDRTPIAGESPAFLRVVTSAIYVVVPRTTQMGLLEWLFADIQGL